MSTFCCALYIGFCKFLVYSLCLFFPWGLQSVGYLIQHTYHYFCLLVILSFVFFIFFWASREYNRIWNITRTKEAFLHRSLQELFGLIRSLLLFMSILFLSLCVCVCVHALKFINGEKHIYIFTEKIFYVSLNRRYKMTIPKSSPKFIIP